MANGKIVFVRGASGGHAQLWAVNPDGSGVAPLTALPGASAGPAWSPDGRKIVFWVEGQDSNRQPYVMNADGSDARTLIPKTSDVCCFAWQPLQARAQPE